MNQKHIYDTVIEGATITGNKIDLLLERYEAINEKIKSRLEEKQTGKNCQHQEFKNVIIDNINEEKVEIEAELKKLN
jgi:hypothetical protein